jgi:hypothetical protein
MPRNTEILRDAQALAEFSNLEPAQVEYFRNNYSDFAPQKWWDNQVILNDKLEVVKDVLAIDKQVLEKLLGEAGALEKEQLRKRLKSIKADLTKLAKVYQWQVTQAYLKNWWGSRFKDDINFLTTVLGSVFEPDPPIFAIMAAITREGYPDGLPEDTTVEFPEEDGTRRIITSRSSLREGCIPMQRAIVYLFQNPWRARFCKVCNRRFVAAQPKSMFCEEPDQRGEMCSHKARTRSERESWHKHKNKWRPPRKKRQRHATRATKTGGN